MKQLLCGLFALATAVVPATPARADDAQARAVIEKAVKAHGGQEVLSKLPGISLKFKGKFHGMGDGLDMSGDVIAFGPDRQKIDLELKIGNDTLRIVNVLAGDKGWTRVGDMVQELTAEQLAEAREQAHSGWVTTLEPLLREKSFRFALIGEMKIDKQTTIGVKVSRKGHRDVDLYFDKETGLLAKSETTIKEEGSDQEVTEESFFSEYKEFQGQKQATRFVIKRGGKLFLEGEATGYELSEKLSDDVFAKP